MKRSRLIQIGKVYEIRTKESTVYDSNIQPVTVYAIIGTTKKGTFQELFMENPYQVAIVLEMELMDDTYPRYRCMVGTTDIWLGSGAFIQELTPKRARQL